MGKNKELIVHITAVLFITFVLGIYVSGSGIDVWAAEEVMELDCRVVIDYVVKAEFGEYRKDSNGNPTDDRCDGVRMNKPGKKEISAKVKAVRHENGTTDYSVLVDGTSDWSDKQYCVGTNYEAWQGSDIVCSGYVKADNLTISGAGVSKDEFNSGGYIKLDVTDAYKNSFKFGVTKLYDTNADWVIDKWDYSGTEITGVSLEFIYPTYTIEYSNNGGTGSISSYNVGYNQKFTLSNGTGISKVGYELDNWCVLRKTHRGSYNDSNIMTEVFCTDGQWHEFKDAYATNTADAKWQTFNKNSIYTMDTAWVKGDWNNNCIFVAQWTPKKYNATVKQSTGILGIDGGGDNKEVGSKLWLHVQPANGYLFDSWNICSVDSENSSYSQGTIGYGVDGTKCHLVWEDDASNRSGKWRVKADVNNATKSNINYRYTGLVENENGWYFAYNGVFQTNRVYPSISTDSTKKLKNYYYPMMLYY